MADTAQDARHRRLTEVDSEVEKLKARFEEALESFPDALTEVTSRPEIDRAVERRLRDVAKRLKQLKPSLEALNFDVGQSATLWSAILDVDNAMHADSKGLDQFERVLVGIERVRHVIRDAIDEFVGGADADRRRLLDGLFANLPGIKQAEIAELLGVDPRTVRRWAREGGEPEHRLVLVARIVAVLRHAWTPAGSVAWFHRARRELDDKAPIQLLDDPANERQLISAARASRTQYAT